MELKEFLIWLASAAGASAAMSFIAQRIKAIDALPSTTKSYIHLGGSIVLALGAWAIATYVPPEVIEQLKTPFQIVAGVVLVWLTSQLAHKVDPAA